MATAMRLIPKAIHADVRFTRSGWKQFNRMNLTLGARFIRACVLKHELAVYLAAHEANGICMDTQCQEIRYDDGVYLLLRRTQGVWYITDVILANAPDTFLPVYAVRNVLRGVVSVIALALVGWRPQIGGNAHGAVIV